MRHMDTWTHAHALRSSGLAAAEPTASAYYLRYKTLKHQGCTYRLELECAGLQQYLTENVFLPLFSALRRDSRVQLRRCAGDLGVFRGGGVGHARHVKAQWTYVRLWGSQKNGEKIHNGRSEQWC